MKTMTNERAEAIGDTNNYRLRAGRRHASTGAPHALAGRQTRGLILFLFAALITFAVSEAARAGTVQGSLFLDLNADGVKQVGIGESGSGGVTVNLKRDGGNGIIGDGDDITVATDVTSGADGGYSFTGVAAGTYYVNFDISPFATGFLITAQDQGGNDTLDSDPDPTTGNTPTFSLGASATVTRDIGIVPIRTRSASGSNPAVIQSTVDDFRADLGALNPNNVGSANGGRREINWDGVPDNFAAPNSFPADFFNSNSPRGVVVSTPGTGFQLSADSSNPTSTPVRFANLNASYSANFQTFSPQRLFTALGSNVTDVDFFVPGTATPGFTQGFGAVFTDVETAGSTTIEFFNQNGASLGKRNVPTSGNEGLSFFGISFVGTNQRVLSKVRITSGAAALGAAEGANDLVVMDDFIYGEPVPDANLVLTASGSPDPVVAGTDLTYTLTLSNDGTADAQNVTLTDNIPVNTTFVAFNQTTGPAFTINSPAVGASGTVTATIPTLAAGASATFTLTARVNPNVTAGSGIVNSPLVTSNPPDTISTDNGLNVSTTVTTQADLSAIKTAPAEVVASNNLTYTINVSNAGPSNAQAVSLSDIVPADTTFVSLTQNSGPAFTLTPPPVGGTGTATANISTLAAGASATFSLVVKVNPATAPGTSIGNTANIASTTTDLVGGNNSSTATTLVIPPTLAINDVTVAEGNAGSVNATFTVTLSSASGQTVTVDFFTSDGTASEPGDYTAVNGPLTFAPGQTTRTITVPVKGDTTPEGDESFFVNLSNATGATLADNQGVGTITNDDAGGALAFSASTFNVNENAGPATITVSRTGSTIGAVTVNFQTSNGSATAGSDYGNTSGTLFFGSGETSKTFDVPVINDSLSEGTETVNLTLSLPTGGAALGPQSTAALFILDDEAPPPPDLFAVNVNNNLLRLNANAPDLITSTLSITGLQSAEQVLNIDFRPATGQLYALGSTGRIYIIDTSTGAATQVGVAGAFTLNGTDFGLDFNPAVDRIRIVSDADQNLRLNPNDGTLTATDTALAYAAGDLNFGANPNITGAAYTNNFAGTGATTLYDIDSNLDVLVRQGGVDGAAPSPNAGQLSTVGSLGVNTTGLTGFDIRSTGNTAYASLTSPGETSSKLYTVNLSTGAATLVGPIGGATLIRDIALAPAGSFQFSAPAATVAEDAGKTTVTVTRAGDTSGAASVNLATSDGTATQKGDYTLRQTTLTFNPGEISKSIEVFIIDDGFVEGNETFNITLNSPTNDFTTGPPSSMVVTISDNDVAPGSNPIAQVPFFLRQHYIDFLNREPDAPGFAAWQSILNGCPAGNTTCDRVEVSSAFYRSEEFQGRGYFLYRFYRAALGRNPHFGEFMMDLSRTSGFLSDTQLEAAKVAFVLDFMLRPEFRNKYDAATDPSAFVSLLEQTAGVTLSNRQALITGLQNGTETRATVLRKFIESAEVATKFFNEAFVVEAYFGYLRRDPDALFQTWVQLLNQTNDRRVIVNGFVNSLEYVQRFGQ